MKHIQITVSGKVQGVFFRAYTEKKANELGISGFVKNQDDGSVYIDASGTNDQLNKLVAWCHKGSPLSSVNQVVHVEINEPSNFTDFQIKR